MPIHIAGVVGLVAIFVIGTIRPINLGVLALVATFVLGTAFAGESARRAACGHHRGDGALAREAGVKTLVLTHIPPDIDTPEARDRAIAEIREIFDGTVVWGEDQLAWTVTC